MIHDYSIAHELRGYSRQAVDRLLRNLDANVQQLEAEKLALADQVVAAQAELEVTHNNLTKAQQNQPNFAGLGSKFEEVLRVAETQAEKMITDAHAEAEMITSEAIAAAQRHSHKAEDRATRVLTDAKARAEELRLSSETTASELSNMTNQRLSESGEALTTAKRESARIRAEADSEIVQLRLEAQGQLDMQRLEVSRLQEEAEHRLLAAERAIAVRQEEAEIAYSQRHDEAQRNAQAVLDEANAKAKEVNRRAHEVSQESENLHMRVQQFVDENERNSREQAKLLIENAQQHADATMHEIEVFSDSMLARALTRLEQTRVEVGYVQEFVSQQRMSRTADSVIAHFEEQLREAEQGAPKAQSLSDE